MAEEAKTQVDSKLRSGLIISLFAIAAIIVFGLLWFLLLAPSNPSGAGWYLFSFAAGLSMIVLPCTLPLAFVIVPLSMGKGVLKGLGIAFSFSIGVAVMLSIYGIVAAVVGGIAINSIGAPLESIKNWVYLIAGIFALLFALSEIGLLKVHMPTYTGSAPAFIQRRQDYIKAFMLGLFLGNIGVGCPHPATPLILIEIASSGSVVYGWTMFLTHAIGRVLPLIFLALLGILGVNALSWLVKRKDKVERVTGWGMVFVAGFILTLGLFTHDWWVNSGIHTQIEVITQEAKFNAAFNEQLGTNVEHVHGVAEGTGLLGLPLVLGNWFLVLIWVIPIWWYWWRRRRRFKESPASKLRALEAKLDRLEKDRRQIESAINLDDLEEDTDLKHLEAQIDKLEEKRRKAAASVDYGEEGELADTKVRNYEVKLLNMQRKYFIALTIILGILFIYILPHDFLHHQSGEQHDDHDDSSTGVLIESTLEGETFSRDITGLPNAVPTNIVELQNGDTFNLVASIVKKPVGNREVKMLAYNGSVPGPIIKADQGSEITINFTNDTDIETTIHSHGIRIDNKFDGVPGVTQDPIGIGETFTYKVRFPDAGVYWYHPHMREDYTQEHGLYGNYIVEPLAGDYWSPVNREVPLVVDDILIDGDKLSPFYKDYTNFALLGRFGNEMLVNGQKNYVIDVEQGEVIRFQVTNVASTRTFNLSIPDVGMKMVGADLGRYEQEEFIDDFIIAPAERMIVEAHFTEPGVYKLIHATPDAETEMAFFNVSDSSVSPSYATEFSTLRRNQDVAEEFASLARFTDQEPDKNLRLTVDLGEAEIDHNAHLHNAPADDSEEDHGDHDGGEAPSSDLTNIQWEDPNAGDINSTSEEITWKLIDMETGLENMMIDWNFQVGDYVKVRMFNDPEADHVMQHPMHFHGQRFAILTRNGAEEINKAWKDTVLVPTGGTLEVLVEMSNPGVWMAHCHIAEHLHSGMMLGFRVEEDDNEEEGDGHDDHSHAFIPRAYAEVEEEEAHVHDDSHPHEDDSDHGHGMLSMPESDEDIEFLENVIVGKYQVAIDGGPFEAHESTMTFTISDVFGRGIALEEFDGASVHLSIVNVETGEEIHAHSAVHDHDVEEVEADDGNHDEEEGDGHDDHSHAFIPRAYAHVEDTGLDIVNIDFEVTFPSQGVYKIFVQFKPVDPETSEVLDEPVTAEFFVNVTEHVAHEDGHDEGEGDGHDDHTHGPALSAPWYVSSRWWILFISSLVSLTILSLIVRRVITVKEK